MSLATCKEILTTAQAKGIGVAGIDVLDHASTEAIIAAAEEQNRPVILMVPEAGFPLTDINWFFPYLVDRAKRARVPLAVHLDHGEKIETVQLALDSGFSSVMIDGSRLPLQQNIALTRSVVEMAHAKGVSV